MIVSRATIVDCCCNYMQPKIIHNKQLNLPLWLYYRMRGQGHRCHCEGRNQSQVEPPMPHCLTTQVLPHQVRLWFTYLAVVVNCPVGTRISEQRSGHTALVCMKAKNSHPSLVPSLLWSWQKITPYDLVFQFPVRFPQQIIKVNQILHWTSILYIVDIFKTFFSKLNFLLK